MNSRGKPLTTFEIFKADFESIIKTADPTRHAHLVDSIDGVWADLLWEYEKRAESDFKIDDEFERYLTFIIEVSEWRDGQPDRKWHDKPARRLWPIEERARLSFADPYNQHASRNRDFFFHAFDTWIDAITNKPLDPGAELGELFRAGSAGVGELPLFSSDPDLFGACISRYGFDFSAQETLLLFATLLARQAGSAIKPDEVNKRLRSLRNITAAFLDLNRMSGYVAATEKLMLDGELDTQGAFRADWVADELYKWPILEEAQPDVRIAIHQLEDHPLVRGRIMSFDLEDTASLPARARAFLEVGRPDLRDRLGAALLTKGDYSRAIDKEGERQRRQLGSSQKDDSWTDMLTTGSRAGLASIGEPLMKLLDDVVERAQGSSGGAPETILDEIRNDWLADREIRHFYDWRYYLVRYSGARSSKGDGYYTGRYVEQSGGFGYRRLRMLHGSNYGSYFSDALLRAAWVEGALKDVADEPSWYHDYERGLTLKTSGIEVHCQQDALELSLPPFVDGIAESATEVLAREFAPPVDDAQLRVRVAQKAVEGCDVDSEDRVQLCIRLVRALAEAGL